MIIMENDKMENDNEWNRFTHLFKKKEIPAHTELLIEGEFADEAFIILKGCLRTFTAHGPKNITLQFFFEDELFFCIQSFFNNKPSSFSLETIEPCTVYAISKKDFYMIVASSVKIQEQIDQFILNTLLYYQEMFDSKKISNPEEKYARFLKNNPKVLLRIQPFYMSSLFGITTKSLIRIQNKYDLKNKKN